MVARLHDAGLEVILDVVYNHTAEGMNTDRRCRSEASTMLPTIVCCPTNRAIMSTTPVLVTR